MKRATGDDAPRYVAGVAVSSIVPRRSSLEADLGLLVLVATAPKLSADTGILHGGNLVATRLVLSDIVALIGYPVSLEEPISTNLRAL